MVEGERTTTKKGRRRSITGEDVGPVEVVVGSAEVASNAGIEENPPKGTRRRQLTRVLPRPRTFIGRSQEALDEAERRRDEIQEDFEKKQETNSSS